MNAHRPWRVLTRIPSNIASSISPIVVHRCGPDRMKVPLHARYSGPDPHHPHLHKVPDDPGELGQTKSVGSWPQAACKRMEPQHRLGTIKTIPILFNNRQGKRCGSDRTIIETQIRAG